jgi:hypothetical protein
VFSVQAIGTFVADLNPEPCRFLAAARFPATLTMEKVRISFVTMDRVVEPLS